MFALRGTKNLVMSCFIILSNPIGPDHRALNVIWLYNGSMHQVFQTAPSSNVTVRMNFTRILTISNVEHGNSGNYCCVASVTGTTATMSDCIILSVSGLFATLLHRSAICITLSVLSHRDSNNWQLQEPQSGQYNNDHLQCSTAKQYNQMAVPEWLSGGHLKCSDTAVSGLHHQWECVHMFSELTTTVHSWRKKHHCHCSKLVKITQI